MMIAEVAQELTRSWQTGAEIAERLGLNPESVKQRLKELVALKLAIRRVVPKGRTPPLASTGGRRLKTYVAEFRKWEGNAK